MSEPEAPPSAEKLRMILLEKEMERMRLEEQKRKSVQEKLAAISDSFLHDQISKDELAMVRRIVMNAVADGKYEAMVYSFPSSLCTDKGRAINNSDPSWPDTLRGKAKELFERYKAIAKPAGYRLKAMIINFPDGIPGDVGFFLNWEPEAK